MKYLLPLVLVLAACSSTPPPKGGYINIAGEHNELLAQVNPEAGTVKFFESEEKTVMYLVSIIAKMQQPKPETAPAAAPKPVEKKK